ncbi:MAG: hypothetical protein ACKOBW_16740 [Planctomycetota bacterium]
MRRVLNGRQSARGRWILLAIAAVVLLNMTVSPARAAERNRRAHWVERATTGSTQKTDLVINQRAARAAASQQRALENYPKFNGAFSSRFYTDYGYPTGTHGMRMLPW